MMAGKAGKYATRIVTVVVVAAIVAVGVYFFVSGSDNKKVTARFSAAVGVYEGTPVRQLGVEVGDVTKVTPSGSYVEVEMEYESQYSLPADATAIEVANSLVSDRFIQLSPYTGSGPKLASGSTIPESRTSAPAELDDIYKALNKVSVALGPNGANKTGALADLVTVGAANLKGNGAALGRSITNLSRAAGTLANGREDLFGTVTNLRKFTGALRQSDKDVRSFNTLLASVSNNLADERGNLGEALKQLGLALRDVNAFVKKNAGRIHTSLVGLKRVTNTLVRQRASLEETLALAPVALANIVHAYQPNLGVLATRSNLASLFDPGQLCVVISVLGTVAGKLSKTLESLFGTVATTLLSTCNDYISENQSLKDLLGNSAELKKLGITDLVDKLAGLLPSNGLGLISGGSGGTSR